MELECTQVDGTLSYPVEPYLGPSLLGVTHLVPQGNGVGSTWSHFIEEETDHPDTLHGLTNDIV